MSTSTKLIEFFARVPQCKGDGTNWTFYCNCFVFAAKAAQLDDYLVETAAPLSVPVPADPANPTKEETNSINCHPGVVQLWKANKAIVKQALASTIPNLLFLKVKGKLLAGKMWKRVKEEFEKRSKMMTVDLCKKLQKKRCPENSNVKAHLLKLKALCKELTAMEADLGNNNFIAILLSSLPTLYDPYLAALTATSALLSQTNTLNVYIHSISNKANCWRIKSCIKKEGGRVQCKWRLLRTRQTILGQQTQQHGWVLHLSQEGTY